MVHIDKALTQFSIGYSNEAYVAERILPEITVDKQSDKYWVYGKERFLPIDDRRSPGVEVRRATWSLSTDSYYAQGHGFGTSIPYEEYANSDDELTLEEDNVDFVMDIITLNQEIYAAETLLNEDNYLTDFVNTPDANSKWSHESGTPIKDIEKAAEQMHKAIGRRPNKLLLSQPVVNALKFSKDILSRIQYVKTAYLSENDVIDILKNWCNLDEVIVGGALRDNVHPNLEKDPDLGYIWGNSAILFYDKPTKPKREPVFGKTFVWNAEELGGIKGRLIQSYWDNKSKSQLIDALKYYDQKIVTPEAGYLFNEVVVPLSQK